MLLSDCGSSSLSLSCVSSRVGQTDYWISTRMKKEEAKAVPEEAVENARSLEEAPDNSGIVGISDDGPLIPLSMMDEPTLALAMDSADLDDGLDFESFTCNICGTHELCYFFDLGNLPHGIAAGSFCILDPFSEMDTDLTNPASFDDVIVMGRLCNICGCQVCVDSSCSILFQDTFCRDCALFEPNREIFPDDVIQKLEDSIRKREESRKQREAQTGANKP